MDKREQLALVDSGLDWDVDRDGGTHEGLTRRILFWASGRWRRPKADSEDDVGRRAWTTEAQGPCGRRSRRTLGGEHTSEARVSSGQSDCARRLSR